MKKKYSEKKNNYISEKHQPYYPYFKEMFYDIKDFNDMYKSLIFLIADDPKNDFETEKLLKKLHPSFQKELREILEIIKDLKKILKIEKLWRDISFEWPDELTDYVANIKYYSINSSRNHKDIMYLFKSVLNLFYEDLFIFTVKASLTNDCSESARVKPNLFTLPTKDLSIASEKKEKTFQITINDKIINNVLNFASCLTLLIQDMD